MWIFCGVDFLWCGFFVVWIFCDVFVDFLDLDIVDECIAFVTVFENFIGMGRGMGYHFSDLSSAHWATALRRITRLGKLFNTFTAEFVIAIEGDSLLFCVGVITNGAFRRGWGGGFGGLVGYRFVSHEYRLFDNISHTVFI